MKTVITCGHPYSGFQLAYEAQAQAGLACAQPSRREAISIEGLHEKIFRGHDLDPQGLSVMTALAPGRIWQDLSVDLFIGNIEQGDWGWADARSVWLLNFWSELEPRARFVLAYSAPEYAIGHALRTQAVGANDIDGILASWVAYHSEMLSFYNRNADRCLLVNVATLLRSTGPFIEALNSAFNLKLSLSSSEGSLDRAGLSAVAATLAKRLIEDSAEVNSLYSELESTGDIADPDALASGMEKQQAIEEYLALIARVEHEKAATKKCGERVNEQGAELGKLTAELQEQAKQLAQTEDERNQLKQQRSELTGKQEDLKRQLDEAKRSLENVRAKLAQENESLLGQLHQAQEELEDHFLQVRECTTQRAAEQARAETLILARDEQAKLATDRQVQIQKMTQARDEQAKLATDRQVQIQKMTQARDEQAKLATDRQAQIQKLTQARDEQAKLATDRQAQIQKLTQTQSEHESLKKQYSDLRAKHAALESRLKDAESAGSRKLAELDKENEILLLQLHQVQEELEHYFQQSQELPVASQASPVDSSDLVSRFWQQHPPREVVIDFRDEIDGDNWYYAEHDGRWAGPDLVSTLRLPTLKGRRCEFSLDVVDAMEPEILAGMTVALNGQTFETTLDGAEYPAVVAGEFAIGDPEQQRVWEFQLSLPGTVSPVQRGSEDQRHLGVRVRSLRLRVLE